MQICIYLDFLLLFGSFLLFLIGNLGTSIGTIEIGILLITIHAILFCISKFQERLVLLLFMVCIFTFQMAKVVLGYFIDEPEWNFGLSSQELQIGLNLLFLTYFCIIIGYIIGENSRIKIKSKVLNKTLHKITSDDSYKIKAVQNINLTVYIISFTLAIFFGLDKMYYAILHGYMSLYTTYVAPPGYTQSLFVCITSLFIGLASYPSVTRKWFYLITGGIIQLLLLIQGSRAGIMCYLLFSFYFLYEYDNLMKRKTYNKQSKLKLLKWGIVIFVLALVILPFMYSYGHTRTDQTYKISSSVFDGVKNFFFESSSSFGMIKYAIIYKGQLPQKYYSLGAIINLFTGTPYSGQTVEGALYARSFGNAMTYMTSPTAYLNGFGLGSSYIAEVFYDFGYIGVIIVNLLLGMFFQKFTRWNKNGMVSNAIYFFVMYYIMLLPRFSLLYPLTQFMSKSVLATFAFVFLLSMKKKRMYAECKGSAEAL